ncbi:alpha/beta hydrolase [Auritidibacter ignavus]|uniref:alpha/beta fold hydrolase n=1 Tax=Auritidibacter ignavus TaxID=678932 RepID=UPI002FE5029F
MVTTFALKTVYAGSFKTSYLEAGNPANPTVVLIHDGGFGTSAELCWGRVIPQLAEEYHVLAPELLGWGGTDKAVFLDRPPYEPRVQQIADFCSALDITEAHFVGASFGGSVLLRALCAPNRPWPVKRAVSISGTGGPYRLSEGIAALADFEPSVEAAERMTGLIVRSTEGMEDHIQKRYENSLIPGHWEAMTAPRLRNPSVQLKLPPDPYLDQLTEMTTPVLLVEGRYDTLLEQGWSQKLAALSPAIEAIEMDFSHEPNIDAPRETSQVIWEFLRKEKA